MVFFGQNKNKLFIVFFLTFRGNKDRIHIVRAGMAELADAYDSGSYVLTDMQVQVLLPALQDPRYF